MVHVAEQPTVYSDEDFPCIILRTRNPLEIKGFVFVRCVHHARAKCKCMCM